MPRRRIANPLLIAAVAALGCGITEEPAAPHAAPAPPDRVRVSTLLTRLQDADAKVRADTMDELNGRAEAGFAPRDGVRLLQEAAKRPPGWPYTGQLIWAAAGRPGPDDIPAVIEAFPRYSPEARWAALTLLARLPDADAAEALLKLAQGPPPAAPKAASHVPADRDSPVPALPDPLPGFPVGTLADRPRHAGIFFPALLDQLPRRPLQHGILRVAAAFAEAGLLTGETLGPHAQELTALLVDRLERTEAPGLAPGPDETSRITAAVQKREEMRDLVDLLALVPTPTSEDVLRRLLPGPDAEVSAHAAVALIRREAGVDPEALAVPSSDPGLRLWLWGRLRDLGQADRLPQRFRTQEALAESEFVSWLARSPGLGRAPDAIEPMGDYPAIGRLGRRRVYLLRFRIAQPEELARRGWMAGWVSYPPDGEPTLGGEAATHFLPWDDRSPRGHVAISQDEGGRAGAEEE